MNILQRFQKFNSRFARFHLRAPWLKLKSEDQCLQDFYAGLNKVLDYDKEAESMTTSHLADELEMIMLSSTGFSRDDALITEAVRRLRGPGSPATAGTATEIDTPAGEAALPTRRSEP